MIELLLGQDRVISLLYDRGEEISGKPAQAQNTESGMDNIHEAQAENMQQQFYQQIPNMGEQDVTDDNAHYQGYEYLGQQAHRLDSHP